MRELNSKTAPKTVRPERIIQFGTEKLRKECNLLEMSVG